jgi:catechol 2,3-dioxygenase-like lactoylglutathione lyase family enzyme
MRNRTEAPSLSATASHAAGVEPRLRVHHFALETGRYRDTIAWYQSFLGAHVAWATGEFSELTRRRLPGIREMAELRFGDVRIHLLERACGRGNAEGPRFQHVCLAVGTATELDRLRQRSLEIFKGGEHRFDVAEPPSQIVVDDDGVTSFYCLDPNGLELELTHIPAGSDR